MDVASLSVATEVDAAEWDRLASKLGGGVFHCHAHTRYSARLLEAEPLFAKARNAAGDVVGLAAGTISTSSLWPFSRYCKEVSLPSLPLSAGGDAESGQAVLEALEGELKRRGVWVVRTASYDSPHSLPVLTALGYARVPRWEHYFDLTVDREELLRRMGSNRRRQLRKAEQHGLQTCLEDSLEAFELVIELHNLAMKRRGERQIVMDEKRRRASAELLASGTIRLLITYLDGQPVNGDIVGLFNRRAYGMVSGSTDDSNRKYGPVQLIWVAMETFQEMGATVLSLGGSKEGETGLRKFKQEFGPIEVPQPSGTKTISDTGRRLASLRGPLRRPGRKLVRS